MKIFAVFLLAALPDYAADARKLTLQEAVHLAIAQNHSLKIARLKIVEAEQKKAGERSAYFPTIGDHAKADHNSGIDHIAIPAGTLGAVDGSLVPAYNVNLPQGSRTLLLNQAEITQPITQLIRIHQANRIAAAEIAMTRDDLKKAEIQVAVDVHNAYFGILIAQLQRKTAEAQTVSASEQLRENEDSIRRGNALKVAAIESQANVLEGRQSMLTAEIQISDLTTELNDLMGLQLDTQLDLNPVAFDTPELISRENYTKQAQDDNPEITSAHLAVSKAKAAVIAAKSAYIPDVSAYVSDTWQNGISFLVPNFVTAGVQMNWTVFDFGKRRAAIREREAQLAQAEENVKRLEDRVASSVERAYNKMERTHSLVSVANQLVALQTESERLAKNQLAEGVTVAYEERRASAALFKSQADYLQANLNYALAYAELQQIIGRVPDF